jgi:hypothetical protein
MKVILDDGRNERFRQVEICELEFHLFEKKKKNDRIEVFLCFCVGKKKKKKKKKKKSRVSV